jgi:hypothetical protein
MVSVRSMNKWRHVKVELDRYQVLTNPYSIPLEWKSCSGLSCGQGFIAGGDENGPGRRRRLYFGRHKYQNLYPGSVSVRGGDLHLVYAWDQLSTETKYDLFTTPTWAPAFNLRRGLMPETTQMPGWTNLPPVVTKEGLVWETIVDGRGNLQDLIKVYGLTAIVGGRQPSNPYSEPELYLCRCIACDAGRSVLGYVSLQCIML